MSLKTEKELREGSHKLMEERESGRKEKIKIEFTVSRGSGLDGLC